MGRRQGSLAALFSPDGRRVLTSGFETTALRDSLTGKEVQRFEGHEGAVFSLAFSPNGQQVLDGKFKYCSIVGYGIG